MVPILIGGWMTCRGYLSVARFVAIYLVSYTIGYQFQELAYFLNTLKSSRGLKDNLDQETAALITDLLLTRPETVIEVMHH